MVDVYAPPVRRRRDRHELSQKGSITGSFQLKPALYKNGVQTTYTFTVRDLKGWVNGSLKELASSVGVEMPLKTKFDHLKSRMGEAFKKDPLTFLRYGVEDVTRLEEIVVAMVSQVNWMLVEVLELPSEYCFTPDTIPYTTGSLIAKCFELYILNQKVGVAKPPHTGVEPSLTPVEKMVIACGKHGELVDKRNRMMTAFKSYLKRLYVDNPSMDDVFEKVASNEKLRKLICNTHNYKTLAYSLGGISTLMRHDTKSTVILNALISGGRTNNERPWECTADYTADIDLSSCYGSALRGLEYPLGVPVIYGKTPSDRGYTLGGFLDKFQSRMKDNLWTITVSRRLSFEQDLIYSKLTDPPKMGRSYCRALLQSYTEGGDADKKHFDSDLVLLRRELKNSVITSHILKLMKAVSSCNELNELSNTQVETAVFWDRSQEASTLDDWMKASVEDRGTVTFNEQLQGVVDTRTKVWYSLPLEGFIGRLVDKRKEVKRAAIDASDATLKQQLNAKQTSLKLFINTLYGCFASPYFKIGNTVLANNITAAARGEVWWLAKALNTVQTVTDGGCYSLERVFSLRSGSKRKPSLHSLANPQRLERHRSVKVERLGGVDWPGERLPRKVSPRSLKSSIGSLQTISSTFGNLTVSPLFTASSTNSLIPPAELCTVVKPIMG